MSHMQILMDLGLLSWSVILLGLRNGWANLQDAIDYAASSLLSGNNVIEVAIIASGTTLNKDELFELISSQVKASCSSDIDKWRLVHLIQIAESDDDANTKLKKLQVVYADYNYPDDMHSCSIYSPDKMDPLLAMLQLITKLKLQFLQA